MIVRTWCENTQEGMSYFAFNGYKPICRIRKNYWFVKCMGNKLDDVEIVNRNTMLSGR